ncbi:MAG: ATP-binding cassette domain-containing protein [Actinomycetota bacterium]
MTSTARPGRLGMIRSIVAGVRMVWRAAPREFVVLAVAQVVAGMAVLAEILVARRALTELLEAERRGVGLGDALPWIVAVLVLHSLVLVGLAVQSERQRLVAEKTARRATGMVLDVAGRVSQAAYDSPAFYDRLERARASALVRPMQFAVGLVSAMAGAAITGGVAIALLLIEPLLVAVGLVSLPVVLLVARRNTGDTYALALRITADDRRRLHLEDVLSSVQYSKEVRAYGLVGYVRSAYEELYRRRIGAITELVARRMWRACLSAGMAVLGLIGAAVAVRWLVQLGRLDLAAAGAALLGLILLSQRVNGLATGVGGLMEAAVFLDDIRALDAEWPPGPEPEGSLPVLDRLRLDGVTFTYPGCEKPVVRDVSLEICRGEVIGLVGENGSGKTTLVKLLCGLYSPSTGAVEWNGAAVSPGDTPLLRDRTAVLFQDYARYQLSSSLNIGTGRVERVDDHNGIHQAAERAGAAGIVAALPAGYDTVLSRAFEAGAELSAGQWQRVALARALFRDADLVILDEPTASLDARAEQQLYGEIREMAAHRAVVLVSHRAESLLSTDRIYVMHEGRLVESGTHVELTKAAGPFTALFGPGS